MLNLPQGYTRLLVAVSGGGDSITLMHLLHQQGVKFHIATVNHGLRATNETAFVAGEAAKLGIPCEILHWEGEKPTTGLQEAARNARYALLVACAKRLKCDALVTAHTQDDQAETVLMRLLRGSGVKGMAGMAVQSEMSDFPLLRPLLWVTRQELRDYLHEHNLSFVDDPSNENTDFTRVRLRQFLAQEQVESSRLARFSARLAMQNEAIDTLATRLNTSLTLKKGFLNAKPLAKEPFALVLALMQQLLHAHGDPAVPEKLERLESLCVGLLEALAQEQPLQSTLKGAKFSLSSQGMLAVQKANPRRVVTP